MENTPTAQPDSTNFEMRWNGAYDETGSLTTRPQEGIMGTLALELSGNFDPGAAVLAGILGAMAMLAIIYGGRAMGMTRMDLLRTLGTMVAPRASSTTTYAIGTMMHLMVRDGEMEAPGVMLTGFGSMTPAGVTMAHAVFGLVAGAVYVGAVG